jgi:hypothetical protein
LLRALLDGSGGDGLIAVTAAEEHVGEAVADGVPHGDTSSGRGHLSEGFNEPMRKLLPRYSPGQRGPAHGCREPAPWQGPARPAEAGWRGRCGSGEARSRSTPIGCRRSWRTSGERRRRKSDQRSEACLQYCGGVVDSSRKCACAADRLEDQRKSPSMAGHTLLRCYVTRYQPSASYVKQAMRRLIIEHVRLTCRASGELGPIEPFDRAIVRRPFSNLGASVVLVPCQPLDSLGSFHTRLSVQQSPGSASADSAPPAPSSVR